MKQVGNRHLTDLWAVLVQGHGHIIAPDFCVAHREANSGLSTLNRTKTILSIYHQQRQLQKQRGMCINDTYPFCQQPLSGNCHSICFSKPVLWAATPCWLFLSFTDDKMILQAIYRCTWYIYHYIVAIHRFYQCVSYVAWCTSRSKST